MLSVLAVLCERRELQAEMRNSPQAFTGNTVLLRMLKVRIGKACSLTRINHQTNTRVHQHQRQCSADKPFAGIGVFVVRGKC